MHGRNRLSATVEAGRIAFAEIPLKAENRAGHAMDDAEDFGSRGPPCAPFALIALGGGFSCDSVTHEDLPIAEAIDAAGLRAFVLTCRTGCGAKAATRDMARALMLIPSRTGTLDVAPSGRAPWGASAGARMAAWFGGRGRRPSSPRRRRPPP